MRKVKIVALVLSAALALQFSIPAFAAAPVDDTIPSTSENIAAEQVDIESDENSSEYVLKRHANNLHPTGYPGLDMISSYRRDNYVWSSSNTTVVTVNSHGTATAQGLGTAVVSATSKSNPNRVLNFRCVVKDAELEISSSSSSLCITYDNENPTTQMKISDSFRAITYADWTSSNPEVASIDSNGNVTAYKEGTTIIRVSTNEGSRSYTMNVSSNKGAVYFSADRAKEYGSTYRTMLESGKLGDIKIGDVINLNDYLKRDERVQIQGWSSSNPEVATVTESGWVTAVGEGEATITVTSTEGKSAECRLLIGQAAQEQYREAVKTGEMIQGVLFVTALGIVIIVLIASAASGGANA